MEANFLVSGLAADVIKVQSQVDERTINQSFLKRGRKILLNQGVRGLYRGITPACIGSSVSWGLYFEFYERTKKKFRQHKIFTEESFSFHFTASTVAGCLTCVLTNPIWVIKTRLELQTKNNQQYSNTGNAFIKIFKQEGISGLYRGLVPALLLTSNGAIQFMLYEELKLQKKNLDEYFVCNDFHYFFFIGVFSKIIATSITYPYQVIKSRIQQKQNMNRKYKTIFQSAKLMIRNEGLFSLYKGLVPTIFRVAPNSAVTLTVYEFFKN
eukprot:maker-scaffold_62-snap-gene-0.0-mRNA-1 protein AED:0.02 eAED:0.02 QI:21/1/1/1/0/0/2/23/267